MREMEVLRSVRMSVCMWWGLTKCKGQVSYLGEGEQSEGVSVACALISFPSNVSVRSA